MTAPKYPFHFGERIYAMGTMRDDKFSSFQCGLTKIGAARVTNRMNQTWIAVEKRYANTAHPYTTRQTYIVAKFDYVLWEFVPV